MNADYSCRVAGILSDAIYAIKGSNNALTEDLAQDLQRLQQMSSQILTLTQQEDETLRFDKIKYDCEEQQKNEELTRLEAKLGSMREERNERRMELECCLSELRISFTEKEQARLHNQKQREQIEISEMGIQRDSFQSEYEELEEEKTRATTEMNQHKSMYTVKEAELQAKITELQSSLQQLTEDHEMATRAKQIDIDSVRTILEQQNERRRNLVEHFKRVDMKNAQKEEEETKLRLVSDFYNASFCSLHITHTIQDISFHLLYQVRELEKKANALLDKGATALQKLWRGMKGRALVTKMKKGKKKGSKKKKKK